MDDTTVLLLGSFTFGTVHICCEAVTLPSVSWNPDQFTDNTVLIAAEAGRDWICGETLGWPGTQRKAVRKRAPLVAAWRATLSMPAPAGAPGGSTACGWQARYPGDWFGTQS
jgi:hypothetical protein